MAEIYRAPFALAFVLALGWAAGGAARVRSHHGVAGGHAATSTAPAITRISPSGSLRCPATCAAVGFAESDSSGFEVLAGTAAVSARYGSTKPNPDCPSRYDAAGDETAQSVATGNASALGGYCPLDDDDDDDGDEDATAAADSSGAGHPAIRPPRPAA